VMDRSLRYVSRAPHALHSFPTRRSSDLRTDERWASSMSATPGRRASIASTKSAQRSLMLWPSGSCSWASSWTDLSLGLAGWKVRSEEHTSELQSHLNLVCRLLLEKKNRG